MGEEALTALEPAGWKRELKLQRGMARALWRCPHLGEALGVRGSELSQGRKNVILTMVMCWVNLGKLPISLGLS